MNALYALVFLATEPMVHDLNSAQWKVREHQTQRLKDCGLLGTVVAVIHRTNPNPEIAQRCLLVASYDDTLLPAQHFMVYWYYVLYPIYVEPDSESPGQERWSRWLVGQASDWYSDYIARYPATWPVEYNTSLYSHRSDVWGNINRLWEVCPW